LLQSVRPLAFRKDPFVARLGIRLNYANVIATIAIFIALGGSSYAAVKITGKQVKDSSLTGADIRNGSLRAVDLRRSDFQGGAQGNPGAKGDTGPRGDPGAKGETGTVDTSNFYPKSESDALFLNKTEKAADADRLDGRDSTEFVLGPGRIRSTAGAVNPVARLETDGGPALSVACFGVPPGSTSGLRLNNFGDGPMRYFDHVSGQSGEIGSNNWVDLATGTGQLRAEVQVSSGPNFGIVSTITAALDNQPGCTTDKWWAQAVTSFL
jgi:hypothetical protein